MKKKKQPKQSTNRVHDPADVAEIATAYGCSDRHARRLLSELGKDHALEMRDLQAEKLRLQILRHELWLADMKKKYVHRDEVEKDARMVVGVVRQALDELVARLCRDLPGQTAPQMAPLIQDAVHDCRQSMDERLSAEIAKQEAAA
jgi:hypothetical protein